MIDIDNIKIGEQLIYKPFVTNLKKSHSYLYLAWIGYLCLVKKFTKNRNTLGLIMKLVSDLGAVLHFSRVMQKVYRDALD